MFDIQLQLLGAGRPVTFDGFVDSILAEVVRRVGAEMQNLLQARPVSAEIPPPFVGPMEIDIGPRNALHNYAEAANSSIPPKKEKGL